MCLFIVQIRYQVSLYVSGSLVADHTDIVGVIPTTGLGGVTMFCRCLCVCFVHIQSAFRWQLTGEYRLFIVHSFTPSSEWWPLRIQTMHSSGQIELGNVVHCERKHRCF